MSHESQSHKVLHESQSHKVGIWEYFGSSPYSSCKAQTQKYFVPCSKCPKYKLHSANLELVTIVECATADRGFISPGIIFEGKQKYEAAWFEVDPKILYVSGLLIDLRLKLTYSSIGLSDNRWTSDFHCFEWFKDVFIPQAEA